MIASWRSSSPGPACSPMRPRCRSSIRDGGRPNAVSSGAMPLMTVLGAVQPRPRSLTSMPRDARWLISPPRSKGINQAEEGVPAIAADVAAGSAADLAPGHLGPDVVLRSVGVQRDLRAVEHPEQLRLVGVQPREQPVQDDKASPTPKDPIKPHAQFAPSPRGWLSSVSLEVTVEPPDQRAQVLLHPALWWSVKVSSLCTRRSACTQHSAWHPTMN